MLRNKLDGQVFTLSCRIQVVGILTGCGFVGNWYRYCGRLWVASRHLIPATEAKEFSEAVISIKQLNLARPRFSKFLSGRLIPLGSSQKAA